MNLNKINTNKKYHYKIILQPTEKKKIIHSSIGMRDSTYWCNSLNAILLYKFTYYLFLFFFIKLHKIN